MEDSMIDRPSIAFDEKVGNNNKRDRDDDEEEIVLGRLEKRPSGILLGVDDGGHEGGGVEEGGQNGGGVIDTFISNVFHNNNNENVTKEEEECEVEHKGDGRLGVDNEVENGGHEGSSSGGGGDQVGGGGIIKDFFSNIFPRNGNDDDDDTIINGDDDLAGNQVVDKNDDKQLGTNFEFENGGGGELIKDLNAEKIVEKHDLGGSDLPSKDLEVAGNKLKMKPDDYSERLFFLNNN